MWYAANAGKKREYARTRYAAHPKQRREYRRIYRAAHPERVRESNRAWYAANAESQRERSRVYRAAHLEQGRENARAWAARNPGLVRVYQQNRRARKRNLPNTFTAEQARFALEFWHGCCAYCGRQFHDLFNERTLAFDHYLPLSSPDCPGTTASNLLPACNGIDGCNTSKGARDPEEWLMSRFGKRKARRKLAEIEAYFEIIREKHGDTEQE